LTHSAPFRNNANFGSHLARPGSQLPNDFAETRAR
jgi:hypothetical protein